MLRRLKSVFLRYKAQHFEFTVRGFLLQSKSGQLIGNVDKITVQDQRISFQGWCRAAQVSLVTNGGGTATAVPSVLRNDVSDTYGGSPNVGFHLSEAYGNGRYTLALQQPESDFAPLHIRPVSRLRRSREIGLLGLKFLAVLLRALPPALVWWMRKDQVARQRMKSLFDLSQTPNDLLLDPAALPVNGALKPLLPAPTITIVMPVFNAFDLLPEVLSRVVDHTDLPWRLILIEDCSSDPALRPWLRQWVQTHLHNGNEITLIENDTNLGFIRSVNRGLRRAQRFENHVVLLNSDALLPNGWASRLLAPICSDHRVASATPMSNDAEICSVPTICDRMDLAPGLVDQIDRVAQRIPVDRGYVEMPTGVGFCMAMNIAFLRKCPRFDLSFGRGYGEEVDWCQTTRKLKGRHVAVPNLFVEHRGGKSFGSAEKQALIARNNRLVTSRYPKYDLDVQKFVAADPLITARMTLAVAWAAQQAGRDALPIYLAHSLGGGADLYQEDRMTRDWEKLGLPSIVLRVGGTHRWRVEVHFGDKRCIGSLEEIADVKRLLASINRRRIIYSCGVGDRDPMQLPRDLLSLKTSKADQVEVLVHDYFMISPTYTLLNAKGVFHDPLEVGMRQADWQDAWGDLIAQSDRVCVFSQSSRDILLATYPSARRKIVLQPHDLLIPVPKLAIHKGVNQRQVVAVLGNIGFHKGAEVVCALGRLLERRDDISLIVLGAFDPLFEVPKNVRIHGSYDLEQLPKLVAKYQITDWLIPSIWPETFSYTTHEALATGLTTYAFDIGAQGDAVASRPNGCAIPYSGGADLAQNALNAIQTARRSREKPAQRAAGL